MYEIETISVEIDREGSPQFMKQLLTFISNLLLEYTGYISHDNFFFQTKLFYFQQMRGL